jgi:serine/threonine-protein kinase RsbW
MTKKTFTLKTGLDKIEPVVAEILGYLSGVDKNILHDVKLAVEEAIINAMKHGNGLREDLYVFVDLDYDGKKITIAVQDEGAGFNYKKVPDPTADENILKGHGRGVFLIRKLMDEVRFNDSGNRLEMIKYIK